MLCILIRRRLSNFEPAIARGVPAAMDALLLSLLSVDPAARPTAEEARTGLAGLAAESVTWAAAGGGGGGAARESCPELAPVLGTLSE